MVINKKLFIELYNLGKPSLELSELFNCSERTIQKEEYKLRKTGEIDYRKELNQDKKTHFPHKEIFPEVKLYLDNARSVLEEYNDIYKKVPLKINWKGGKQTEDLILNWSDMHTGMINRHPLNGTITYNQKIQEEELQQLLRGTFRFYQLYKPSYNLETLYIFDEGDNITNDRIYDGQKMEITCGVGQQIIQTLNYQSDFIKRVLEIFPRIVIIKVPGNHARTTSKPVAEDATNSFEYLLGKMMQERFKDNKRVEVIVPESYLYTAEIRGHKYLLLHGNTISGRTLNSIERANQEIALLAERNFYDVICLGHFHTALKLKVAPNTVALINGGWIEWDDFAYHKLRKFSSATQYLFNVSKKSPMHNLQEISLRWKK